MFSIISNRPWNELKIKFSLSYLPYRKKISFSDIFGELNHIESNHNFNKFEITNIVLTYEKFEYSEKMRGKYSLKNKK